MAGGRILSSATVFSSPQYSECLGPTQPPSQWVPEAKWPGHEADHSPSSTEVRNGGGIPLLPYMTSWHSAQLIMHRDSFTFGKGGGHVNVWGNTGIPEHFLNF
jgi:hypothetical protein